MASSLLDAFAPGMDLSCMVPDSPEAYLLARKMVAALVKNQESRFKKGQADTFNGEGLNRAGSATPLRPCLPSGW